MVHSIEEIKHMAASIKTEDIPGLLKTNDKPNRETKEWMGVINYYDSKRPRPYSMRDMEDECFHKNLCK